MIPADAGSKHAVARTVRGHPGLQPLKGKLANAIVVPKVYTEKVIISNKT